MTGKRRQGKDPVPQPPPAAPPPAASPATPDTTVTPPRSLFPPAPPPGGQRAQPTPPPAVTPPPAAAAAAPTPPLVITPAPTRREARRQRQQRRRKFGATGIAAAVAIALIVVAAAAFGVHKAVSGHGGATRDEQQSTVLLQVQGADRTAVGSILLSHDSRTQEGLEVMVPNRILSQVCGYGEVPFAKVLSLTDGPAASRRTVSSLLGGASVDGSWVLSTAQLARLVDSVGGVTVTVDVNVERRDSHGGATILVPKGSGVHLTGQQAAEFATYVASPDEDASAVESRLQEVVDGVVRGLPTTTAAVEARLSRLGAGGGSTLGSAKLATLLVGLAGDDARGGASLPIDLPVTPIDVGSVPSYRVDTAKATALARSNLADSLPTDAGAKQVSVELLNGVGTPGLVTTTCPRLARNGLVYAGSGNTNSFGVTHSVVEVPDAAHTAVGQRVAKALGLPTSAVELSSIDQTVADVLVVLGRDYKP